MSVVSSVRLTPTSYVVLGLVEICQPATPYDIKRAAELSVANFWSLAHTQLYAECGRLATAGLLHEQQEREGRRRRIYRLTAAGRKALDAWRAEVTTELLEIRDLGILKLFFGAEPAPLAAAQLAAHRDRLAAYKALAERDMPEGMRLALQSGIGHEREFIRFWRDLATREG